jgi:hypothetical protein
MRFMNTAFLTRLILQHRLPTLCTTLGYILNLGRVYVFMNIGNLIMNVTYLSYLFVRAMVEKTLNLIQFCSLYSGDDDYVKISQFFIFHIPYSRKT